MHWLYLFITLALLGATEHAIASHADHAPWMILAVIVWVVLGFFLLIGWAMLRAWRAVTVRRPGVR